MFERRMYESRVGEPVADDTVKATKNTDNHFRFLWIQTVANVETHVGFPSCSVQVLALSNVPTLNPDTCMEANHEIFLSSVTRSVGFFNLVFKAGRDRGNSG